jgi:hypothetical protein
MLLGSVSPRAAQHMRDHDRAGCVRGHGEPADLQNRRGLRGGAARQVRERGGPDRHVLQLRVRVRDRRRVRRGERARVQRDGRAPRAALRGTTAFSGRTRVPRTSCPARTRCRPPARSRARPAGEALATGGGFSTRALRTDDDEVIFSATRPLIFEQHRRDHRAAGSRRPRRDRVVALDPRR